MDAKTKTSRILLIAEAANPEWTSVPLIGWNLYRALAKIANVHLVTHLRNREAILRQGLVEGQDFTTIDNERIASPLYKISERLRGGSGKGWTTITGFSSLAYYSFEQIFWRMFSKRISRGEFDVVHRITPLSPTSPSIIAKRLAKLNVPFVIGPLNGGLPWPKNFRKTQYAEHDWFSHVRWLYKLMPGYLTTRRYSSAIIVGSQHTYKEMPHWCKAKCVYIPENGIAFNSLSNTPGRLTQFPLRIAFVGRLVPYKGADLLLKATEEYLRSGKVELHIVGDGPQRENLELLVERLNVEPGVQFHGWLQHSQVQSVLSKCDFLALPSVREFGGGVVIEAMALGLPAVVADYGGPSELVDRDSGFKVGFWDNESLVEGLRRVIGEIVGSPELLVQRGISARQKVIENLTWDVKALQILKIYEAVVCKNNDKLNSLGYVPRTWAFDGSGGRQIDPTRPRRGPI